jgi:hypothetical protein
MGREAAPEPERDLAAAVWVRLRHVRLAIGRRWGQGLHTQAADEYRRIARLSVPAEAKVETYRGWLAQHAPAHVVDEEIALLTSVARRFPSPPPVRRLRVVEPDVEA